jgi:hypothetical protein
VFIYQILFPPGATLHRQNEITTIISEITSVPIANFGFLRQYIYIVLKVIGSQFQIQRKCVSVEGESQKEIAIS